MGLHGRHVDRPYAFLSRTGDGVFVVDGEQRIVLWNDAAKELLGFRAADVLGRHCENHADRFADQADDVDC